MGWWLRLGATLLLVFAACTGESTSEDRQPAGGTSGTGPAGDGGSISTGGAGGSGVASGGATAGGMGGAAGGGAAGEPSVGGAAATGSGTGGLPPDAAAGSAGLAGSGGDAGSAGDDAGAGGSGGSGLGVVSFVDPMGDASSPDVDLIRGAFYRDGEFLELRMWFAGAPLRDGAVFSIFDDRWSLSVHRDGAGLSLQFVGPGLDLGLDACAHVLLDEASGLLIIRVPRALFSTTTTVSLYAGAYASGADRVESVPWTFLAYPGADPNASPACAPWSTARTSTLAFRDISLGDGLGCGVTLAGAVVCWGEAAALSALGSPPSGSFEQVSVSVQSWWGDPNVYACGLRADRQIACWGGSAPSVTGTYRSMGDPFGCAVRDNGDLSCVDMGTGGNEIRSVPGPIAEVVGAGLEECHRTEAGSIVCLTQGMAPAGSDFIGLAFGSQSGACGLHADGRLDCEGASIPYRFQSIDAGGKSYASFAVGCGLTQTGSPICWGDAGVVASAHPGPFVRLEVSSTTEGICGFRADSTLVCWDHSYVAGNPVPATTPP